MKGSVDRAEMHYIIAILCKHFEARKRKMMEIAKKVGKGLHPDCYIELVIEDSYYNMHEQVIAHPHVAPMTRQAMVDRDIEPQMKPIPRAAPIVRSSHLWDCRAQTCLPVATTITAKHEVCHPRRNGESGAGDRAYRRADGGTQRALIFSRWPGRPRVGQECRMAASSYPAYGPAGDRRTRRRQTQRAAFNIERGSCLYAGWRLPSAYGSAGERGTRRPGKRSAAEQKRGLILREKRRII